MKKQELFDTVLGTLAPKYGDVETERGRDGTSHTGRTVGIHQERELS